MRFVIALGSIQVLLAGKRVTLATDGLSAGRAKAGLQCTPRITAHFRTNIDHSRCSMISAMGRLIALDMSKQWFLVAPFTHSTNSCCFGFISVFGAPKLSCLCIFEMPYFIAHPT
jgi:hypothetical protein